MQTASAWIALYCPRELALASVSRPHLQDNTLFPLRCVVRYGIYSVQELFPDDKVVLEPRNFGTLR